MGADLSRLLLLPPRVIVHPLSSRIYVQSSPITVSNRHQEHFQDAVDTEESTTEGQGDASLDAVSVIDVVRRLVLKLDQGPGQCGQDHHREEDHGRRCQYSQPDSRFYH